MLVLSRKPNQEIVIDGNIILTVIEIKGQRVKIGITAPTEINIRRRELKEKTNREDTTEQQPN